MAKRHKFLSRLARFVIDITIRPRKLKVAGIALSWQHLSAPEVSAFIKLFLTIN